MSKQAVSTSNREQLQPLINLAMQCSYNSTIRDQAHCLPATISIAIAAVATVQQFNMTADFVKLSKEILASGSVPLDPVPTRSLGMDIQPSASADVGPANKSSNISQDGLNSSSQDSEVDSPANTSLPDNATDSSGRSSGGKILRGPRGPRSARSRSYQNNTNITASDLQYPARSNSARGRRSKDPEDLKPAPAPATASPPAAAAAANVSAVKPKQRPDVLAASGCDYHKYRPGEYPETCPPYFVSNLVNFLDCRVAWCSTGSP